MAAKSLAATPQSIELIERALTNKQWSRDDLWKYCDCSRQPSINFCSGKKVSKKLFVGFCKALDLDWEEVAGVEIAQSITEKTQITTNISTLVQDIRQKVNADIHNRCGTMRVLDMEQPIGIGEIYTRVNILEKLSGRQRLGVEELWQDCNINNFDRLMLGQIRVERVPGLEAVSRYNKLMILGKPGAGKTTFMKRLATQCNQGEFESHRIPVFVTLKELAESADKPDLQSYISQQWKACEVNEADLTPGLF
ncbi:NACHT domain-containing NTPase [Acaryochloris sp. CCMEE 5410]|uniref:NACHT domain-containing protein n=1 Tax=Acaryochloris sp. CCMEE 5410 TaxID=310037 RepID=UPI0021D1E013|nr:NACHT domain-containing protein [Acaryochloris sp. CCMEE 5410]KAI9133669.1 NACHT domain-containing protein [Acaryochloris sp. CCMEE 5410]